jgi:acyl dehydratase
MRFDDLKIGQFYEMSRIFTQQEVMDFAKLSYDTNPIHTDSEFAKTTQFGQLIVPGFLTGSMFSAIIGTKFPGFGSIYLNQNMSFRKPVFPNQFVTAVVRVKDLFPDKHRVLLETNCYDENRVLLIEGTALVKLP